MLFKIICGIAIVLGFSYLGLSYGEKLKHRVRQLKEICDSLTILEFNIRYMNYPIVEAFYNVGQSCDGIVGQIFKCTSKFLAGNTGSSPGEAFLYALKEERGYLMITDEEIDILKSFSKTLGEGDREMEISNIKTTKARLLASVNQAEEEIGKKVKISRSMGVMFGLFIVIVLF